MYNHASHREPLNGRVSLFSSSPASAIVVAAAAVGAFSGVESDTPPEEWFSTAGVVAEVAAVVSPAMVSLLGGFLGPPAKRMGTP